MEYYGEKEIAQKLTDVPWEESCNWKGNELKKWLFSVKNPQLTEKIFLLKTHFTQSDILNPFNGCPLMFLEISAAAA